MNMAPLMLKKNPEIVETVRKCRKYTGSAEIRELADKCYQRFKVRTDGRGRAGTGRRWPGRGCSVWGR